MKKILFFTFLISGFFLISFRTAKAQCFEGDFPPDSYFQCVNGQICQGNECVSYDEVPRTYLPSDQVLDSQEEEIWYKRQWTLWQDTGGQTGCHPYTTCSTSYSVDSTNGCPGSSCGQKSSELGLSTANLNPWGKYQIEECKSSFIGNDTFFRPVSYYLYRITSRLYSTTDKCTNIDSSNQCLAGEENKGLWTGSCEGSVGDFYKCCCHNQTMESVSSVSYYGETNDSYPPLEGACPAGSSVKWRSGASIDPSECQNICKPTLPVDPPLFCDLTQNCRHETLEALGISPHLATTFEHNGVLKSGLTKPECNYLCGDLYVCKDSVPVSVKGKYTNHDDCLVGEGVYCFKKEDLIYEQCLAEGISPGQSAYYYCAAPSYDCSKTSQTFSDSESCENTMHGKCYRVSNDCEAECPPEGLGQYYWCNPAGGCSSGNYLSGEECEQGDEEKVCYSDFGSCSSACRTSGVISCNLPETGSGDDIAVSLEADPQCVPIRSLNYQSTLSWEIGIGNSCGEGEEPSNNRFSCVSCNMPSPSVESGSVAVSADRTTEYGISCTRAAYRCCWEEDEDYSCNCVGEEQERVCETCTRAITICDDEHAASTGIAKTSIRVVPKPVIQSFTADPVDILYTAENRVAESGYNKFSTLSWTSLESQFDFPITTSCVVIRDDGTSEAAGLNQSGSRTVSPSRTTIYTLQCRNSDDEEPETCYSDSETENATVRVFGAGIEEPGPQTYLEGFGKKIGQIINGFLDLPE